jgi:hypothetical protein
MNEEKTTIETTADTNKYSVKNDQHENTSLFVFTFSKLHHIPLHHKNKKM